MAKRSGTTCRVSSRRSGRKMQEGLYGPRQALSTTGRRTIPQGSRPIVQLSRSSPSPPGVEAFTSLLDHLPVDTGMALVLIQNPAPHHESMLAKLLSRETAMPVHPVENGAVLSRDQVYVIQSSAAMTIAGLELALKPRRAPGQLSMASSVLSPAAGRAGLPR